MSTQPLPNPPEETSTSLTTVPKFGGSLLATDEDYGLTPCEKKEVDTYNQMLVILGPAGGSIQMCPGNQDGLDEQDKCPHAAKCPLLRMGKAVAEKMCIIELTLVQERFGSWAKELNVDPLDVPESDRISISDLTWMDVQEQRCLNILAKAGGEEARLMVTNPKELDPNTLLPVAWEKLLHPVVERLDQIISARRLIMKDLMITREQKWKVARAEGNGSGNDISSQQSARADKLRKPQV
jgi:hypothetical protein